MGGAAGSSTAVIGGRTGKLKSYSDSQAKAVNDLGDAWRLAYVVVVDDDLATRAVTMARASAPLSRLDLFEATLRVALTRASETPSRESKSAVTAALWQLPAIQRAALWLATVNELEEAALASVLGLTAANAGHVAQRAAEWLDVALDHESGPLCPEELRLADFADGHLPAAEEKELRGHIPDCPTCRNKMKALAELTDLRAVLQRAVPPAPASLAVDVRDPVEAALGSGGTLTLAEPVIHRVPAVRALAACCAALLIIAVISVFLVRPAKSSSDPVPGNDPRAIVPGLSSTPAGGTVGASIVDSAGTVTTIPVTTSSIPLVTFPTIPAGRHSTTKR